MRIASLESNLLDISLRSTFRTHWKTIRCHQTVHTVVRATDGAWGEGEAYTLEPEKARGAIHAARIEGRDPWEIESILDMIQDRAGRSAVDLALHDLLGRACGVSTRRFLGLTAGERTTCASIGIAERSEMLERARYWIGRGFRVIKVKLTTSVDPGIIHEIRAIGGDRLEIWVDANQAFDPESAVETARAIESARIAIFEQPLPVGMIHAYAAIRPQIRIPILLDEEIRGASDVTRAAAAGGIDGINVKLAKMGGLREALRAIYVARAHGMQILLGCFFESSLGISGSAQLLGLVDHADLDAPLHIENDPYGGLEISEGGAIHQSDEPGLGVRRVS